MRENSSPHPPRLRLTSVYPGHALIPRTPRRTPAGNGFVLHGPWGGLAAGAGGRQEQAPSATDSSSALAESARERPELGMTPVSKVPPGSSAGHSSASPHPYVFLLFSFFGPVFPTRPIHFPERYHTTPIQSCFSSHFLTDNQQLSWWHVPSLLRWPFTKVKAFSCLQPSICSLCFAHMC